MGEVMNIKLYCKSMGKIFRVTKVALNDQEANDYCTKHKDQGVIAVDNKNGLVYIAEFYSSKVPSSVLPD